MNMNYYWFVKRRTGRWTGWTNRQMATKNKQRKQRAKKDRKREIEWEEGEAGGNNYAKYGFHACQRTTTPGKWIWNMPLICTQCTVYTERKKKQERQHWNLLNNLWPQLGGERDSERGRAARRSQKLLYHLVTCFNLTSIKKAFTG